MRSACSPTLRSASALRHFGGAKGMEPLALTPHGPLMLLSHKPIRTAGRLQGPEDPRAGRRASADRAVQETRRFAGFHAARRSAVGHAEPHHRRPDRQRHGLHGVQILRSRQGADVLPALAPDRAGDGQQDVPEVAGPELEAIVREEAFKAQQKVEAFGIEDIGRTVEIWKKNGGESIVVGSRGQAYLDQVRARLRLPSEGARGRRGRVGVAGRCSGPLPSDQRQDPTHVLLTGRRALARGAHKSKHAGRGRIRPPTRGSKRVGGSPSTFTAERFLALRADFRDLAELHQCRRPLSRPASRSPAATRSKSTS